MLGPEETLKPWHGNADQMSAGETLAFWRQHNACGAEVNQSDLPDRDPNDGCRVHAQHWEGKAPVVFYRLDGHGWPMQRVRDDIGTGPKPRDHSAPKEFWNFIPSVAQSAPTPQTPKP